jgi:NAD(P)-dependent dehydrogenase (short-subunit alcohol dehydrogenase family)
MCIYKITSPTDNPQTEKVSNFIYMNIYTVTGGNKGIGKEIARKLGQPENDILCIIGCRDKGRLCRICIFVSLLNKCIHIHNAASF